MFKVTEFVVPEEISKIHIFELWFITLAIYIMPAAFNEICMGDIMLQYSLQYLLSANPGTWQGEPGVPLGEFAGSWERNLYLRVGVPTAYHML